MSDEPKESTASQRNAYVVAGVVGALTLLSRFGLVVWALAEWGAAADGCAVTVIALEGLLVGGSLLLIALRRSALAWIVLVVALLDALGVLFIGFVLTLFVAGSKGSGTWISTDFSHLTPYTLAIAVAGALEAIALGWCLFALRTRADR